MSSIKKLKLPEKASSKTSILSYFSPESSLASKRSQKPTLGMRNQNSNRSKRHLKRKSSEKLKIANSKQEFISVNSDPIVISSDGSGEDENADFKKIKLRKKRKLRQNEHGLASTGSEPTIGLEATKQTTKQPSGNGIKKTLPQSEQNCIILPNTEHDLVRSSGDKVIPRSEQSGASTLPNTQHYLTGIADVDILPNEPNNAKLPGTEHAETGNASEQIVPRTNYTMADAGNYCTENDDILTSKIKNEQDPFSPKCIFGEAAVEQNHVLNTAGQESVKDDILSNKQAKSDIGDGQTSPDTGKIAYYLLNFRQILDTVLRNDDDRRLFEGTDDMVWINRFNNLALDAQKLYVRLYHRKVAWLRLEQVNYPDISPEIDRVLLKLSEQGFLLSFDSYNTHDIELKDVLRLLPALALKGLAKSFKINVSGRQKAQIAADICKMCRKQRSVISGFFGKKSQETQRSKGGLESSVMLRACKALGPCYKLAGYPRTVFNRVLLVFDVTRGIDDEQECSLTGSQNAMGQGRHLQLSAILMAGMGKVSYPTCEVDRPTPIFSNRAHLLHYETAFQFQTDILACVEASKWEEAADICRSADAVRIDIMENHKDSGKYAEMLPEFLRCFTAQWVYMRLRSLEVEILQRLKEYRRAVEILQELLEQRVYCISKRGHWWERLALNVDQHLKDPVRSLDVVHESLQDQHVRVGHKLALAQRVNKILTSKTAKKSPQLMTTYQVKLKPIIDRLEIEEAPVVEITGRLLPGEVQTGKSRFVTTERDDDDDTESTLLCSVEDLALSHYKSLGYDHGIHGEGGTFSTLFCLFLWDIIFMPGISDVFRTSYQTHPLDFHTDGFYLQRETAIENRLDLIAKLNDEDFVEVEDEKQGSESSALDVMSMTWDLEYGKACASMNWERFNSLEEAKGFVKCVGGKVLGGVFRRFVKDLRHTRSGLPDLVVWNPDRGIYKMVEVKGPGDRLSTNQRLWIDELVRLGANIEVCRVVAIGGKNLSRD